MDQSLFYRDHVEHLAISNRPFLVKLKSEEDKNEFTNSAPAATINRSAPVLSSSLPTVRLPKSENKRKKGFAGQRTRGVEMKADQLCSES